MHLLIEGMVRSLTRTHACGSEHVYLVMKMLNNFLLKCFGNIAVCFYSRQHCSRIFVRGYAF